MDNQVIVNAIDSYDYELICNGLPDHIFNGIRKNSKVVIKPNWVRQSHQSKVNEWDYIITHSVIITAVLKKVLEKVDHSGRISILDGPETPTSFIQLLQHYPVEDWIKMTAEKGIELEIIDLRDDEWEVTKDVISKRIKLPGDPRGNTEIDLMVNSEFECHIKSKRGYYGADYNISETNKAHNGTNNFYRVSRTVMEADVFINLPKLKTHKKSGITCCLKNLVGVNTYKNYLPHYSIGGPAEGGDQFPENSSRNKLESKLLYFIKQYLLINPFFAKILSPFAKTGKAFFGETQNVIRSGNWHGNDTLWRMVLDLNKIVLYATPEGLMREDTSTNKKTYIAIVDAILCGEKNGPKSPDPKKLGYLICGTNPVAIDSTAATLMGFNPIKIPVIEKAFSINKYKIVDFGYNEIKVKIDGLEYPLQLLPKKYIKPFKPHFGWNNILDTD